MKSLIILSLISSLRAFGEPALEATTPETHQCIVEAYVFDSAGQCYFGVHSDTTVTGEPACDMSKAEISAYQKCVKKAEYPKSCTLLPLDQAVPPPC